VDKPEQAIARQAAKRAARQAARLEAKRGVVDAQTLGISGASSQGTGPYLASVIPRIEAGKTHPTLGRSLTPDAVEKARRTVDKLVQLGLGPNDLVVDYGCGTLRVGAIVMERQEPERYLGFDLDQRLLDMGLAGLADGLAATKRPRLFVISAETVAAVAAMKPDFIFSKGVLQHVPPTELKVFFDNISALAHAGTTIAIGVAKLVDVPQRRSRNSWRHSLASIETVVQASGLAVRSLDAHNRADGTLVLRKTSESN
jgi:hypothetical protein